MATDLTTTTRIILTTRIIRIGRTATIRTIRTIRTTRIGRTHIDHIHIDLTCTRLPRRRHRRDTRP